MTKKITLTIGEAQALLDTYNDESPEWQRAAESVKRQIGSAIAGSNIRFLKTTYGWLPCPFCGNKDLVVCEWSGITYVLCEKCNAQGPWGYCKPEESVDRWNNAHTKDTP